MLGDLEQLDKLLNPKAVPQSSYGTDCAVQRVGPSPASIGPAYTPKYKPSANIKLLSKCD